MDQVELLTAIIEASVALIGFSGLVVALGRRASGEWSPGDKTRLGTLLAIGFILLACALIALILLSAGLSGAVVWALSSVVWVVLVLPVSVWAFSRVVGNPADPTTPLSVLAVNLGALAAAAAVQVANAAYLAEFWPFLLALAVLLLIGVTQFFRLLWFGLFR
jgi:hypothetical protein